MPEYNALYPPGTRVKINDRDSLERFMHAWELHHRLVPARLEYAGLETRVLHRCYYHGGDPLYLLEGTDNYLWHETCPSRSTSSAERP
jgi:hypothetical protein